MLYESNIEAKVIDSTGAFKDCVKLCANCPRRTGEITVKANGIQGWLGKKVTKSVHSSPLKSGELKSFVTNGRHGIFRGDDNENSGTIGGLHADNAENYIRAVASCGGPVDKGNECGSMPTASMGAICDLDRTMERAIDTLPLENLVASIRETGSDGVPVNEISDTQVFVNNSAPQNT